MMWLRACSKCGGDLFRDWDEQGPIISCLQCGRILTQSEESDYLAQAARDAGIEPQNCDVSQTFQAA